MVVYKWTREEMILAADVADDLGWRGVNARTPQVLELSRLLRGAGIHPGAEQDEKFRSPNSVGMKINNLRASHPSHAGIGLRKSDSERPIVQEFVANRLYMKSVAARIRQDLTGS